MSHKWDFELELGYAHCRRCGMRVKAYEVKRGGLPRCEPPPEPLPTPVCLTTDLRPLISCFACEGRLDDKLCTRMRKGYVEKGEWIENGNSCREKQGKPGET